MATLAELAQLIGAKCTANGDLLISSVADFKAATASDISYVEDAKYIESANKSALEAVITTAQLAPSLNKSCLIVAEPRLAYAKIASYLHPRQPFNTGIHHSAIIAPTAIIGANANIAAYAVIGAGVKIGKNANIGAHVVIDAGTTIGDNVHLAARVIIREGCKIGNNVVIHEAAIIGSDGFGYVKEQTKWRSIPQLGIVEIGDDVAIGANTCIDRGALGNTVLEAGVILDNLIQIAHNVKIGENTAIAATSAIAGSTTIGKNCTIAGAVRIVGHIQVADNCFIAMNTSLTRSILKPGAYAGGTPMDKLQNWRKNAVRFRQLDDIYQRLSKLEKLNKKTNRE